jgi:hypothetical protein
MKFPQPQPELSPQEKLPKAQANADHWGAIAADRSLSPEAAAWAFNLARSSRKWRCDREGFKRRLRRRRVAASAGARPWW